MSPKDHPFPDLETERLHLRQFVISDAPRVQLLAGAREVAQGLLLPHPYKDGEAERWIMHQFEDFKKQRMINFAIDLQAESILVGSIGLDLRLEHQSAQLGYWIGQPYWNMGYCTEAARKIVEYGFVVLGLNRIYASHFKSNPASGRVLQKLGMRHEGVQRQQFIRFGNFEDNELYGVLRDEYTVLKEKVG